MLESKVPALDTPPPLPPVALPDGTDAGRPAEWWLCRSAARALYHMLQCREPFTEVTEHHLATLERMHGDLIYAELIFLLTRLRFDPAEARTLWTAVVTRQREMATRLGQHVDVRAALFSYFVDVERRIERPKVVELDWAEWAAASALLDEVTGLPNQRFFREQLAREVERSHRDTAPLSLIVLDADDFKQVNDWFGHDAGTVLLCGVARCLREQAREQDLVVRYGGDEFVVLCPSTPKSEAGRLADELRRAVASCAIETKGGSSQRVTVSVGVATCPGDARDAQGLFILADRAAYQAKMAGKNRVQLHADSTRSYSRRRVAWMGQVVPAGSAGRAIETTELGEGGVAFLTEERLAPGTLVETAIVPPDGVVLHLAARVAWCRPAQGTRWEVAVRFVEPGTDDRTCLIRWTRDPAD